MSIKCKEDLINKLRGLENPNHMSIHFFVDLNGNYHSQSNGGMGTVIYDELPKWAPNICQYLRELENDGLIERKEFRPIEELNHELLAELRWKR